MAFYIQVQVIPLLLHTIVGSSPTSHAVRCWYELCDIWMEIREHVAKMEFVQYIIVICMSCVAVGTGTVRIRAEGERLDKWSASTGIVTEIQVN